MAALDRDPIALAREWARDQEPPASFTYEEGQDYCRICRGEAGPKQPLFHPCKCSGSIRYVHQECLMEWLTHSQKKYCELCKTSFRFTKLYDRSMPATLPVLVFVRQFLRHLLQTSLRWMRYWLVGLLWACFLPWWIRLVWRGLFWMADGDQLEHTSAAPVNLTASNTSVAATIETLATNYSLPPYLENLPVLLPPMQLTLGDIARAVLGPASMGKLLRFISSPGAAMPAQDGGGSGESSAVLPVSTRTPSLLSDVHFLTSWSLHPTVNNLILDIVEGQMICVFLVTAFILVFLIREWVINQQPLRNMPDLDGADADIPVAAAEVNDRQQGQPVPDDASGPIDPAVQLPPLPPRRRALTDDNILNATSNQPGQPDRPEPPVRSQSLLNRWHGANDEAVEDTLGESSAIAVNYEARPFRRHSVSHPHPPSGSEPSVGEITASAPVLDAFSSAHDAGVDDDGEVEGDDDDDVEGDDNDDADVEEDDDDNVDVEEDDDDNVDVEEDDDEVDVEEDDDEVDVEEDDDEVDVEEDDDEVDVEEDDDEVDVEEDDDDGDVEVSGSSRRLTMDPEEQPQIEARQDPSLATALAATQLAPTTSADDEANSLSTDAVDGSAASASEYSASHTGAFGAITTPNAAAYTDPSTATTHTPSDSAGSPPIWDRVTGWLFYVEDDTPLPQINDQREMPGTGNQYDEQIVDDVFAEAPFVPNHNRDAQAPPPMAPDAAPPPDPDLAGEGAPNDLDAADDVEDLDGILELLGMEGPVFAMLQNIFFSLCLLTATVSGSVWCPYVWGKIALLLMSNPTGILVRAPLFLLSEMADFVLDAIFFIVGLGGVLVNQPIKILGSTASPVLVWIATRLEPNTLESFSLNLTQSSGIRLEKALSGAFANLQPDFAAFSRQSHIALVSFKSSLATGGQCTATATRNVWQFLATTDFDVRPGILHLRQWIGSRPDLSTSIPHLKATGAQLVRDVVQNLVSKKVGDPAGMDSSVVVWSTEERILTIVLGYVFFAVSGMVFLELAHHFLGLKEEEKVPGYFADCLRQAGGVVKVIIIIGIEMLVFPFYCGLLLDLALLPLFAQATLAGRISFMARAPFTGIFIHWFVGTCYMFHFALFVSVCRKIFRKGVLYFIRDPDDPTFHPVRDVLDRPVPAQLAKILFSAFVYGCLIIVCLGGVVWSLNSIGGVFPIRWTASEPKLSLPVDVVFYNFMLPLALRKAQPSRKIFVMYRWWFLLCARQLRLSHFLFGVRKRDEFLTIHRQHLFGLVGKPVRATRDGKFVRAPASDSVRITKGQKVFLEVSSQNRRLDGLPDSNYGRHGRKDSSYRMTYLPPRFQTRLAVFVLLLWVYAVATGVTFTVGPLLLGRRLCQLMSRSTVPPNDLYAFTVGAQIFAAVGYGGYYARSGYSHVRKRLPQGIHHYLLPALSYVAGLAYLALYTGGALPLAVAMVAELYVHVPLMTYLESSSRPPSQNAATVYILQSWVVGLLLCRLLYRLVLSHLAPDSQPAKALRAILRRGRADPDVRLATRAFVLPTSALCFTLVTVPVVGAGAAIVILGVEDPERQVLMYRIAYPSVLGLAVSWMMVTLARQQLASWRLKIRDEVYLIGERLHNFHEPHVPDPVVKGKAKQL